ncbi:MAG: hypothetical protein HYV59_10015 [Planctomycetes bacterium]|nr:hypothetical protein [Planctomycetota bacterium]
MSGKAVSHTQSSKTAPSDANHPLQKPADYDMVDSEKDLAHFQPLRDILTSCHKILFRRYQKSDKAAMRHQKHHKYLTIIAAVCGAIAVLFAIVQLSRFFLFPWPVWVEALAALITFVAVILGLEQSRHPHWLLERHKAERCRFLKFRAIIDPALWTEDTSVRVHWEQHLQNKVNEIKRLTRHSLHELLERHEVSDIPHGLSQCVIKEDELKALVDYFKEKRICYQMDYFDNRAKSRKKINAYTQKLPPLLFFLSIVAVFSHFVIDIFFKSVHGIHSVGVILIVLAASFPVIGAGIRTLRSAHEFARLASLFRAKYNALKRIDDALDEMMKKNAAVENKTEQVLHTLWQCEQFLEDEHYEWLRLMLEAEWYG